MKSLRVVLVVAMFSLFSFAAQAQQDANVGQAVSGLINVVLGNVQLNVEDVEILRVTDVLNDNEIRILNNVLNNNEILSRNRNFLNDLDILNDNQIAVGVLSGGIVLIE